MMTETTTAAAATATTANIPAQQLPLSAEAVEELDHKQQQLVGGLAHRTSNSTVRTSASNATTPTTNQHNNNAKTKTKKKKHMMSFLKPLHNPTTTHNNNDEQPPQVPLTKACKLCAKRPLRLTDDCYFLYNDFLNDGLGGCSDNGFAELIYSMSNRRAHGDHRKNNTHDDDYQTVKSIALDQAEDIVRKGARKVQEFQRQLKQESENANHTKKDDDEDFLTVYQENLEAMGLWEWDELRLGRLLGVGGFSNVLEVVGFRRHASISTQGADEEEGSSAFLALPSHAGSTDSGMLSTSHASHKKRHSSSNHTKQQQQQRPISKHKYTDKQRVARKFLAKHAIRNNHHHHHNNQNNCNQKNNCNNNLACTSHHSGSVATTTPEHAEANSINNPNCQQCNGKHIQDKSKDEDAPPTSYRYAVKHLRPGLSERYSKRMFNAAAIDLVMEAQFLLSLQHPNIIKLRGFAAAGLEGYRDSGHHNGYFLILDQLPETLERRLVVWRKKCKRYKSKTRAFVLGHLLKGRHDYYEPKFAALLHERLHVAYEICSAMEYLHSKRMINRDLKVANIGFDIRGDVKLFDFGLSRLLPPSKLDKETATTLDYLDENFRMSDVGTKMYMAPQVRMQQPYSTKADVFSFGIVLWEILALADPEWNRPPKPGQEANAKPAIEKVPLCPCWPQPLQDLMQSVLATEPTDRPSFTQLRELFREKLNVRSKDDDYITFERVPKKYNAGRVSGGGSDADQHVGGVEHHDDSSSVYSEDVSVSSRREDDPEVAPPEETGRVRRRRSTFILDFGDLSWLSNISARSLGLSSRSLRSTDTGHSHRSNEVLPLPINNESPQKDATTKKSAPRAFRRRKAANMAPPE